MCVLLHANALSASDVQAHDTLLDIAQFVADRWHSQDDQFFFKLICVASDPPARN